MSNDAQPSQRRHKLNPDPIRTSPHSQLAGCGPHRSYRHLHHQRGTIGTFHVRLLEGRGLCRKHWSALSLGPMKHLGLSGAHGEVSSFGTMRLAFWRDDYCGRCYEEGEEEEFGSTDEGDIDSYGGSNDITDANSGARKNPSMTYASSSSTATATSSESSMSSSNSTAVTPRKNAQHQSFLPSMPTTAAPPAKMQQSMDSGKSPNLVFDQGCIRTFSPARSPFFPSYASQQQQQQEEKLSVSSASSSLFDPNDWDNPKKKPPKTTQQQQQSTKGLIKMPAPTYPTSRPTTSQFGPSPPNHYAKEVFKSSTVHNDSNPIWGGAHVNNTSHHSDESNENKSSFQIPLRKDDLLPALRMDGGKVGLEVRLDEEMAPTESLLVGGALSTAVGAATAATSVVGMGRQAQNVSNMGMEMLGLGTDRLIGRGYVDLMPLLLGLWEESWKQKQQHDEDDRNANSGGNVDNIAGKGIPQTTADAADEEDATLNEYGKVKPTAHKMRRRVERMGMLDVWVPLCHPNSTSKASSSSSNSKKHKNVDGSGDDSEAVETSGKIHLLISYEPNGMTPKRDDIVAFESFARRPLGSNQHGGGAATSLSSSSAISGPIITPIVPPLSPLLVIETRPPYLLLEYTSSRTITSVDRSGNVKSSRWERPHRVRIHRSALFVVERKTFLDAAGNIARMPGDIVLSTPLGAELAEVSAPLVAGAMELMGPALLWGKLAMAAGGTGVRAGLAGARAATEAVVTASQEKALERREDDVG
eukprot:CAMPEP_0183743920 /NCGR_PEP_ID=MMETSP0737-20130205/65467_1 /TAXON_ID=385413 /ORGANISM="Thalassiosira miniscula, Strain CCMP1093" /LENGTH=755 /DNA_ID=CAMNT_0025979553 /DNA_START=91 /DNA_END=2354 /DNA_ORIENTATION=-